MIDVTKTKRIVPSQSVTMHRLRCIVAQAAGFTRTGASFGDKNLRRECWRNNGMYPLVNIQKTMKCLMGKSTNFIWSFSIAMLVYKRVYCWSYIYIHIYINIYIYGIIMYKYIYICIYPPEEVFGIWFRGLAVPPQEVFGSIGHRDI